MDDCDREHGASNIVGHASDEISDDVQLWVIAYWVGVDPQLGAQVAGGLGHGNRSTDGHDPRAAACTPAPSHRAANSVLAPSLLEAAEDVERGGGRRP